MKNTLSIGANRTGMDMSPVQGKEVVQAAQAAGTSTALVTTPERLANERQSCTKDARSIGSMPPPSTLKGAAKAVAKLAKGEKTTVLVDRLGERLASERTGVRLYEALLAKIDAVGTWTSGPTRTELETFLRQELLHFEMVKEALASLGADTTVVTPSADIAMIASHGVLQVISDVRTNGPQGVQGLVIAELVDREGWDVLVKLADDLGQNDMANRFRLALTQEETHLEHARRWFSSQVIAEANMDLEQMSAE